MTATTADRSIAFEVRGATGPPADLYFERETTLDARERAKFIEDLIEWSHSDDSLDWEAVEQTDRDGWGVDEYGA
jgi:hypothetical protein